MIYPVNYTKTQSGYFIDFKTVQNTAVCGTFYNDVMQHK